MPLEVRGMPTVDCKLTDCRRHGIEICVAKRIGVDGVGQVECYDPVPRSALVHGPVDSRLEKRGGKHRKRIIGVLK